MQRMASAPDGTVAEAQNQVDHEAEGDDLGTGMEQIGTCTLIYYLIVFSLEAMFEYPIMCYKVVFTLGVSTSSGEIEKVQSK